MSYTHSIVQLTIAPLLLLDSNPIKLYDKSDIQENVELTIIYFFLLFLLSISTTLGHFFCQFAYKRNKQ